jgi:hypothetical protein
MVYSNEIGQRVPYNSEETAPGNRNIRQWRVIKDATGKPIDSEERVIRATRHHDHGGNLSALPIIEQLDDGMYVKLDDLLEYAEGMGWAKGKGRPGLDAHHALKAAQSAEDRMAKVETSLASLTQLITGLGEIIAKQAVANVNAKAR